MEDRYYENDIAKVKISFSNCSKEEQDKAFKNIADACYNILKYDYLKGSYKDINKRGDIYDWYNEMLITFNNRINHGWISRDINSFIHE